LQASSGSRSAPAWRRLALEGSSIHGAVEGHAIRHLTRTAPTGRRIPPRASARRSRDDVVEFGGVEGGV
jgi:hypothetical protein